MLRKTVSFKGVNINHLWTQMNSFVLGDREAVEARRRLARLCGLRRIHRLPADAADAALER